MSIVARDSVVISEIRGFPAIMLELSVDGVILQSNEVFDALAGRVVRDVPITNVLDNASSREKLARILANPHAAASETWELVFAFGDSLDSHAFVIASTDDGHVLLIEQPRDPRIELLNARLVDLNAGLVQTQRELARDRARLAAAYEELQRQNDELERANRALDDFAHVVSHDLKAPLRAFGTLSEWIRNDPDNTLSPVSAEHFELLQQRAGMLNHMVDGILGFARARREVYETELVDVGQLVAHIVGVVEVPASARVTVDTDLPSFVTERVPLQQVLTNLICNAFAHAGREDVHVHVGATPIERGWEFCVRDNGGGIPAAAQDRIWELFRTAGARGDIVASGVGLAIVRSIVERRGGHVRLESNAGDGAAFFFEWYPNDHA